MEPGSFEEWEWQAEEKEWIVWIPAQSPAIHCRVAAEIEVLFRNFTFCVHGDCETCMCEMPDCLKRAVR